MTEQNLRRWSDGPISSKVGDLVDALNSVDPQARIIEVGLDDSQMTWNDPYPKPYFVAELIEKKEN